MTCIRIFLPAFFIPFFLLASVLATEARVYLDITSAEFRKIPMAVPYFQDKRRPEPPVEAGREMAALMSRALELHGFVSIIPPENYQGRQDANWQNLGADFALLGQYEQERSGLVLELRLMDVKENRMLLGRRYRGEWDSRSKMVRKFCDSAVQVLTGEEGISSTKIALVSDASGFKEIYLADILGEEIRQVTSHRHLAVSPRFSPDGAKLAYTSYHRGNANLYITDLDQSEVTRPISRHVGLNMAPAWSPDGKKLAITLSKDGNPDLYLMNLRGEIEQRLTRNAGINVSPSWSPDGKKLVFVSDRSGTPQIYIMEVATRRVQRLTYQGGYNTSPSWSPKGDWIAYSGSYEGAHHIFVIPVKGGQPVRLTRTAGNHESPSWSPDGQQLVFSRKTDTIQELCGIFRNGTGFRTLFHLQGNQSFPRWSPRYKL